jgi:hypothetical protein
MTELIEYGIRCKAGSGEHWLVDAVGVLEHATSIGVMQAELNAVNGWAELGVTERIDKRICAFGPDGEPVELGEVASQTGLKAIELLRRYEWVRDTDGLHRCPECKRIENCGHAATCELAALLREVGSE